MKKPKYTQNREISWLRFNERVLEEAMDESVPLFERLRFAAIFANNLDEFFMVRVGSLAELAQVKDHKFDNKSFLRPSEQLELIFSAVRRLYKKRDHILETLFSALEKEKIRQIPFKRAGRSQREIRRYFEEEVFPVLSPQIVDLHHPFPHLVNQQLYAAVLLKNKKKKNIFGIIPIPPSLPRIFFTAKKSLSYILLEDIIAAFSPSLFAMYEVVDTAIIKVTRNTDLSPDEEAFELGEDYLQHMRHTLKKRRLLQPVRLDIQGENNMLLAYYLKKRLNIKQEQVYASPWPVDVSYIFNLSGHFSEKQASHLLYPPFSAVKKSVVPENSRMLDYVQKQDVLIEYPYQDFSLFLQLIQEAVHDPDVLSLKITIYRLGKQKPRLINYLIMAAEAGKDVTVMLELKARFDEENNMHWAELLQAAGCRILYGFDGYKVHSKLCLLTLRKNDKLSYVTQVGTGNYNSQTAAIYSDLSLITAEESIGQDADLFFKNMGIANLQGQYKALLVAPYGLKTAMLHCVKEEKAKAKRGEAARILLKMNSLTDRELIDALKAASCAGVRIDLIVRGICCILPGIPGKTENIHVKSIVGRFLEHSRIFCFGSGETQKMYISSADWMTRNMDYRVEIACPVFAADIRKQILQTLRVMLSDTVKGREMQADGTYVKNNALAYKLDSQLYFMEAYARQAQKENG